MIEVAGACWLLESVRIPDPLTKNIWNFNTFTFLKVCPKVNAAWGLFVVSLHVYGRCNKTFWFGFFAKGCKQGLNMLVCKSLQWGKKNQKIKYRTHTFFFNELLPQKRKKNDSPESYNQYIWNHDSNWKYNKCGQFFLKATKTVVFTEITDTKAASLAFVEGCLNTAP